MQFSKKQKSTGQRTFSKTTESLGVFGKPKGVIL
jgi:hypothetical protein